MAQEGRDLTDDVLRCTGVKPKPVMELLIKKYGSPEGYLEYYINTSVLRSERPACNYYIDYTIDCTEAEVIDKDIWFDEITNEWLFSVKIKPTAKAKDNINIIEYKNEPRG